jgi:predicted MFS family arabinose efflux permease
LRPLWALLLSYGLFGAGYIAYMTFVIAALEAAGAGSTEVTVFWAVLGIAAALGGFVWGRLLTTLPAGVAIAVVEAPLVVGAILPVFDQGHLSAAVSAVLFGGTFLTVVTATTTAVRRALPPTQWTDGIVVLASSFALGQCVGPLLAGALSDSPGGVRIGLVVGAVLVVVSALVALLHDRVLLNEG